MNITSLIAKIGQNPNFIAFMAHLGFSFIVLSFFPSLWTVGIILVLAAVKEFYFDIKYETNQTVLDGLLDYAGYASGLAIWFLGLLLH
jgi:hypothetical protein